MSEASGTPALPTMQTRRPPWFILTSREQRNGENWSAARMTGRQSRKPMQIANEHTEAYTKARPPGDAAERRLLIAFREATLGYGRRVILRDVTLELCEGDFLGI